MKKPFLVQCYPLRKPEKERNEKESYHFYGMHIILCHACSKTVLLLPCLKEDWPYFPFKREQTGLFLEQTLVCICSRPLSRLCLRGSYMY